jgi:hypothetical protein
MISFGRLALAAAFVLVLAPLSGEDGAVGAGRPDVELVRGGKPVYAPCVWAKAGHICYSGNGLSIAPGHRHR